MKLITSDIARRLQANFRAHQQAMAKDRPFDPEPVVKLFTPSANATWLISEQNPDDADVLFGIADLGIGFPELGYVSLQELQEWKGLAGLGVERDLGFSAKGTLRAYLDTANEKGYLDTHSVPQRKA